jgi:hypothetical protein
VKRGWNIHHNNVVETDFDIKVPRKTNLNIDVFSAPVSVQGVEGSYDDAYLLVAREARRRGRVDPGEHVQWTQSRFGPPPGRPGKPSTFGPSAEMSSFGSLTMPAGW